MVPAAGTHDTSVLESDTIVAIATPPGRGGIGVVRLSGPAALATALTFTRLRTSPEPRRAHYGHVVDDNGQRLDDALLTWFPGPGSYTGEDVVELGLHGAPVVLDAVVRAAVRAGARPARAGEFTERAWLRGRLDLSAAEAVRDLIDAQTTAQARLAAAQLGGSLAREVAPVKQALLALIATLEAGIDFAEDDLDTLSPADLAARLAPLLPPLERLEGSFAAGRLLREGLQIAIAGAPNAGKSSLFNRLLGRDRAIVTPTAGTTRDVLAEPLLLRDLPIRLLDTAGLRPTHDPTEDPVERIGIERTHETIADADLVLHVRDSTVPAETHAAHNTADLAPGRPLVIVWNKVDLLSPADREALDRQLASGQQTAPAVPAQPSSQPGTPAPPQQVALSAVTGEGLAALEAAIAAATGLAADASAGATLTNLRQHTAVAAALQSVRAAAHAAPGTPHELLLLDLYAALEALDSLTGQTTPDDVLALIFSSFCIGK